MNKTKSELTNEELANEKLAQAKAEELAEENDLSVEINRAYIDNVGIEYADADGVQEAYQGQYDNDADFVQQLLEACGTIPKDLSPYVYIDWERTASDVMMDYFEVDGYYFRNL
jgi:antirestriction protein